MQTAILQGLHSLPQQLNGQHTGRLQPDMKSPAIVKPNSQALSRFVYTSQAPIRTYRLIVAALQHARLRILQLIQDATQDAGTKKGSARRSLSDLNLPAVFTAGLYKTSGLADTGYRLYSRAVLCAHLYNVRWRYLYPYCSLPPGASWIPE